MNADLLLSPSEPPSGGPLSSFLLEFARRLFIPGHVGVLDRWVCCSRGRNRSPPTRSARLRKCTNYVAVIRESSSPGAGNRIGLASQALTRRENIRGRIDEVSRVRDALYAIAANTAGSSQYPAWGLSWTYHRYGNRTAQNVSARSGYTSFMVNAANHQSRVFSRCSRLFRAEGSLYFACHVKV